jgi:hypothetical protein
MLLKYCKYVAVVARQFDVIIIITIIGAQSIFVYQIVSCALASQGLTVMPHTDIVRMFLVNCHEIYIYLILFCQVFKYGTEPAPPVRAMTAQPRDGPGPGPCSHSRLRLATSPFHARDPAWPT